MISYFKPIILVLTGILICANLNAQIYGQVSDENGDPLSYASVFVQGTSIGTVTNIDGNYSFNPKEGSQQIVFQYIGYKPVVKDITYRSEMEINISLPVESYNLGEVVISANGENPAIAIVKRAIKKRSFYHKNTKKYEVDLYAKGMIKMLDAPTKILGSDIGNMDGMLDSTNQGIVYLSESQSKIYFRAPNEIKEIMHSSKVAESDNAFNSNMLSNAYFNIYEEYYTFGSTILSPLADNALLFYHYSLEGASIDKNGRLVNKISITPKSNNRPLFFGDIYIVDDTWHVSELDLHFTGKSVKSALFDTISIKQIYFEARKDNIVVLHQVMSFSMKLFGFEMAGDFTHVFSNYNLDVEFGKNTFTSETFKMSEEAIKNDLSFWNTARPVPLTKEERLEYIRKDSLKIIWKSKIFLDSVDRENNKFKWNNLLFGYSHQNSLKRRTFSYGSPLSTYQFNAIEGHKLKIGLGYNSQDSLDNTKFDIKFGLGYGFSDKKVKTDFRLRVNTNNLRQEYWQLGFGDKYKQYDTRIPISTLGATYSALIQKNNMMLMFWSRDGYLAYHREIVNGIRIRPSVRFSRRYPSHVNTDFSFFNRDKTYASNNPIDSKNFEDFFPVHNSTEFELNIGISPFQKYMSLPNIRSRIKSKWPDINIYYNKAINVQSKLHSASFDKVTIQIKDNYINTNILGYSSYRITGGSFLRKNKVYFIDNHHFIGTSTVLLRYTGAGFKIMPRYKFSTTNDYLMLNYEHNFNGFILDGLPLVNKLKLKTIVGLNALMRNKEDNYYEASIGLGNVGFNLFRMFRLDYAISFNNDGSLFDKRLVLGFTNQIN